MRRLRLPQLRRLRRPTATAAAATSCASPRCSPWSRWSCPRAPAAWSPVELAIRGYRRWLTRFTPACPSEPSCSAYALTAVTNSAPAAASARRRVGCAAAAAQHAAHDEVHVAVGHRVEGQVAVGTEPVAQAVEHVAHRERGEVRIGHAQLARRRARRDHLPHPPLVMAAVPVHHGAVLRRERGQLVQADDVLGAPPVQVVQVAADQRREPLRAGAGRVQQREVLRVGLLRNRQADRVEDLLLRREVVVEARRRARRPPRRRRASRPPRTRALRRTGRPR